MAGDTIVGCIGMSCRPAMAGDATTQDMIVIHRANGYPRQWTRVMTRITTGGAIDMARR